MLGIGENIAVPELSGIMQISLIQQCQTARCSDGTRSGHAHRQRTFALIAMREWRPFRRIWRPTLDAIDRLQCRALQVLWLTKAKFVKVGETQWSKHFGFEKLSIVAAGYALNDFSE